MSDYLLWSNKHRAWWAPAGRGYVKTVREAGRYSRESALYHTRESIPDAGHVGVIATIPVREDDLHEVLEGVVILPATF